ncbi:hypothetical protein EDI_342090 [Entamoeba dispar SAW760]|uniref:Uncharacterized protein n=1 Tax=Entamoeba dispar (strain ATCC PRA-260 / SAW760) TaxID=370354 RepID=B0E9P1_ENTDS|nr:uncharacterized protein EDI_342090 [Entamoeba dispar SAW760]EDR28759.1 hypothetical protein EDI_342090 [Entamoeba dispar SAW760]|eukprot:EDR28759.1 hypothetical protein EDI_342090 [Entamoeba dispar SAW760]
MLLIFFIALALANKCTFDEHISDNTNYQDGSVYHERYCDTLCPCEGDDCEMDFSSTPSREIVNVTGQIGTLITRAYDLTFAIYVNDVFKTNNVILKSQRIQYKLANSSTITIGSQAVEENNTVATGNTIFRCAGTCTISDSTIAKTGNESISFICEKDLSEASYNIINTVFTVSFDSDSFSHIYARENVIFSVLDNVKFIVDATEEKLNENAEVAIPLMYNAKGFPEKMTVSVSAENKEYDVVNQCDGQWLVAVPKGTNVTIDCFDPTVTTGSESLETGCEIAFIVIICLADTTLLIVLIVFGTLALLPMIKRKLGKGEDDYNKFDELTK